MSSDADERVVEMVWKGPQSDALLDETRYLSLEGAFRSGKTTVGCWKILNYALEHPGIEMLIARWTDDATDGILRPLWRKACAEAGQYPEWNASEKADVFPNGSKVHITGLKSSEEINRYGKFRGWTLAVIWVDQPEELPQDVYLDLKGRLSQSGYPLQFFLTPNPEYPDDHWLAVDFPYDNSHADHKVITISVYDNAHNLEPSVVRGLEAAYPPGTSKYRPAVLGLRGVKVRGKPVYAGYFARRYHVQAVEYNPDLPLLVCLDFGKHHPCVVFEQYTPWQALHLLGGVMGQHLFLEDFLPIALRYQEEWFPRPFEVRWACDPAGSHNNSQGVRKNALDVLTDHKIAPSYVPNSNAPDVRNGAIEHIGGHMRRHTAMGEAFVVSPDRWVIVGLTAVRNSPWMVDGLEAGYVWDEHPRQVGNKSIKVPVKDGWFEHGQNCIEYGEINFGGAQPTEERIRRHKERALRRITQLAQRDDDPDDRRFVSARRGGY